MRGIGISAGQTVSQALQDTHRLCGPAAALQAVVERRHDEPDRTSVDVAEAVTADDLIRRADVRAGAAADAVQRVAQLVVFAGSPAAVVEQDDVQFLRPVDANRQRQLDVGRSGWDRSRTRHSS